MMLSKIRAGRSKPGLRKQHISCVTLVAEYAGMVWEGGKVGDVELTLGVGDDDGCTKEAGVTVADAGGAGSTALMLQSVLPLYTLGGRGKRDLVLKGGTNCAFAPSVEHVRLCLLPILGLMGIVLECELVKRGFSFGEIRITNNGISELKNLELGERNGGIESIQVVACGVGVEEFDVDVEELQGVGVDIDLKVGGGKGKAKAFHCVCVGRLIGGGIMSTDVLLEGKKLDGTSLTEVVVKCVAEMREMAAGGGNVDYRTADQLLVFMALCGGRGIIRVGGRETRGANI
ncbi:hypothetical protein TL16_g07569 [Triparma laevis f. inornata]|uniref:RNA 3'-terminal phosphate cyclase domain-containing protein n=1 Tax=Triparma laevis f. inornata TaxID=1714386 RepID=A0A9W7AWK1_9STRA|nr:hypothetical protein TL16_g07569 [Triparma laevis f. inornata]